MKMVVPSLSDEGGDILRASLSDAELGLQFT